MNMQDRITSHLEALCAERGCQLVDNRHWSNIGVYYVQPKGAIRNLFHVVYDYQHTVVSLHIKHDGTSDHHRVSFSDEAAMAKFLEAFKARLPERRRSPRTTRRHEK